MISKLSPVLKELPPVEFAPLHVPPKRRLQTLAAMVMLVYPFLAQGLFFVFVLFPAAWPLMFAYMVFLIMDRAPEGGGRTVPWLRDGWFWKLVASYFPAQVVKEAELDPSRKYIFGYHPHGIVSTGAFLNLGTNATGFDAQFPGIRMHLLTLTSNFFAPVYRDIILGCGLASVSRKSIIKILRSGPGSACCIVVGGASESLLTNPDRVDLVLAKRLGFVKLAIQQGADLVPVFGFGENSIFSTVEASKGSWLHRAQVSMRTHLGWTMPIWHGRGVFTYNYGLLPRRFPLTAVVGKPIQVKQSDNPSEEEIRELHGQYVAALKDVYDRNKVQYSGSKNPPEFRLFA